MGGGIVPRWVSSLACRSWIRFDRLGAAMGGTNVSQLPINSGWPKSMGPAVTRGQKTQLDEQLPVQCIQADCLPRHQHFPQQRFSKVLALHQRQLMRWWEQLREEQQVADSLYEPGPVVQIHQLVQ